MAFVNFEPVLPLDTYSSTIPANRLAFIGKSLAAVLMALSGDAYGPRDIEGFSHTIAPYYNIAADQFWCCFGHMLVTMNFEKCQTWYGCVRGALLVNAPVIPAAVPAPALNRGIIRGLYRGANRPAHRGNYRGYRAAYRGAYP